MSRTSSVLFHFRSCHFLCPSIYPYETRIIGQVKLNGQKMATRVQDRPLLGRKRSSLRGVILHFITIRTQMQACKVDKRTNLDVRAEGGLTKLGENFMRVRACAAKKIPLCFGRMVDSE